MSKTSDVLYGRQGGRFIAPAVSERGVIQLPLPARTSMAAHLAAEHTPISVGFLEATPVDELVAIHTAEHQHRDVPSDKRQAVHAGHLRHVHPDPKPTTTRKKATRA